MQYLDKAPPDAQKNLFKALIKDVVIYDDRIAITMFIDEQSNNMLPKTTLPLAHPQNKKRPVETHRALNTTSRTSTDCQQWLPELDSIRTPNIEDYIITLLCSYIFEYQCGLDQMLAVVA